MLTIVDDIAYNFEIHFRASGLGLVWLLVVFSIVLDSVENHLKVQNDLVRVNWHFDIIMN